MNTEQDQPGNEMPTTDDPKVFLLAVMNSRTVDMSTRIEAAAAVMPYVHERLTNEDDSEDEDE